MKTLRAFIYAADREFRGAHASRVLAPASGRCELSATRASTKLPGYGSSFRRDAKTHPRDAWAPPLLALTLLVVGMLLSSHGLAAGAGAKPEQKQKEMEAAVAKAATSPNGDLTQLQCGNLVYAGNKSSICFADEFLTDVARDTTLQVGRNFVPVKLEADNAFDFPFCVWSGEEDFALTKKEREHLRKYLLGGGFILSSPGCSDPTWDVALRRELKLVFPEAKLVKLPMSHPGFFHGEDDRAADGQEGQRGLRRRPGDRWAAGDDLLERRLERRGERQGLLLLRGQHDRGGGAGERERVRLRAALLMRAALHA